jgi:integrase
MAIQFKGFRATKPIARLIDSSKGNYEAFFIVYDPAGKKIPIRISNKVNIFPVPQRKSYAQALAAELWDSLQRGWNPIQEKWPKWNLQHDEEVPMSFSQALDFSLAIKKKVLSPYSIPDYEGCVRFMKTAALKSDLVDTDIKKIKRKDIRLIIATAKEDNKWSNNARNKYLSILQGLLTVLVDEEQLEYNPSHKIKAEPTEQGLGYRSATPEEKEAIATRLIEKAPDFFDYIMLIYQSGIRRKELLMLKVSDINLQRREIIIRPEVAKSNRKRIVPIPDDIYQILMSREIYKLPKTLYVFSNERFKPGPVAYHVNTPTKWWKELIQDPTAKGGLGIDVKMYGMKHTGGDDKIRAGIELDVLKTLYGHRSKQMTENYAKAVREQYSQTIIDRSPSFAKVVKMRKDAK